MDLLVWLRASKRTPRWPSLSTSSAALRSPRIYTTIRDITVTRSAPDTLQYTILAAAIWQVCHMDWSPERASRRVSAKRLARPDGGPNVQDRCLQSRQGEDCWRGSTLEPSADASAHSGPSFEPYCREKTETKIRKNTSPSHRFHASMRRPSHPGNLSRADLREPKGTSRHAAA